MGPKIHPLIPPELEDPIPPGPPPLGKKSFPTPAKQVSFVYSQDYVNAWIICPLPSEENDRSEFSVEGIDMNNIVVSPDSIDQTVCAVEGAELRSFITILFVIYKGREGVPVIIKASKKTRVLVENVCQLSNVRSNKPLLTINELKFALN